MKTYYNISSIFENNDVLRYCEDHGIYEVYSRRGNVITYYSLYSEGFYKVVKNIKTGREVRKLLRYSIKNPPGFLKYKYNYMEG